MKTSHRWHVVALSVILFICPMAMIGISKLATQVQWDLGFNDYFSLTLYWLAAGLIWMRLKFVWLIALSFLGAVAVGNLVLLFAYMSSALASLYAVQFILSVAAIGLVILMVDFLNHKFLDRRDQFSILGAAHRYAVTETAHLKSDTKAPVLGMIKSLSISGALFETEKAIPEGFSGKKWQVDISRFSYVNQPVEIVEVGAQYLRLKFLNVNPFVMWKLSQRLKEHKQI